MKKFIAFFFISCPFWLSAQGYRVNVQGQTQQATGNAGTALIQDESAVFYNPGGISFLKRNRIGIGGNATIVKTTVLDSTNFTITKTKTPISIPFTVYAIYGADSSASEKLQKFKLGLGIYTPFGGGDIYPKGWSGAKIVNSLRIQTLFIQPTLSYKFNDKFGAGIGFVYALGKISRNQDLPQLNNGYNSTIDLTGNMYGYGFNAGLYYKPVKTLSIGVTYRSQVNMDVKKGTAKFDNIPPTLKDSIKNGGFTTTMPMPKIITMGAAYNVNEKLILALDVSCTLFKVFDTLRVNLEKNSSANPDIKSARNFQNAYSFHLGGQYVLVEGLTARLGLQYIMSAVPDGYTTPEGADASRLVYSGGLGYNIGTQFAINASYTFQSILRTDHNVVYQFPATYKTYASIAGLSVSYNF
jgi:long-chain fatty acid transport protein